MFHIDQMDPRQGTCTSAAPLIAEGRGVDLPGWATRLRASARTLLSDGRWATAYLQQCLALRTNSSLANAPSAPLALPRRAIPSDAVLSPKYVMPGWICW